MATATTTVARPRFMTTLERVAATSLTHIVLISDPAQYAMLIPDAAPGGQGGPVVITLPTPSPSTMIIIHTPGQLTDALALVAPTSSPCVSLERAADAVKAAVATTLTMLQVAEAASPPAFIKDTRIDAGLVLLARAITSAAALARAPANLVSAVSFSERLADTRATRSIFGLLRDVPDRRIVCRGRPHNRIEPHGLARAAGAVVMEVIVRSKARRTPMPYVCLLGEGRTCAAAVVAAAQYFHTLGTLTFDIAVLAAPRDRSSAVRPGDLLRAGNGVTVELASQADDADIGHLLATAEMLAHIDRPEKLTASNLEGIPFAIVSLSPPHPTSHRTSDATCMWAPDKALERFVEEKLAARGMPPMSRAVSQAGGTGTGPTDRRDSDVMVNAWGGADISYDAASPASCQALITRFSTMRGVPVPHVHFDMPVPAMSLRSQQNGAGVALCISVIEAIAS